MAAYAQTVTGIAPSNVTQRSTVIITGSGFTSTSTVRFYNTADSSTATGTYVNPNAGAVTFLSSTQLRVVVPTVIAAGSPQATLAFRVYNGNTPSGALTYTYTPPALTPTSAGITKVITNFGGYWNSAVNGSTLPDTGHSVMAFQYGSTLYSTGDESAVTNVLASNPNTGTYTTGNWRALPINNIEGTVPANASNPNLIVLASRIDGDPNTAVPTSPAVAGLSVRDVLIDGIRGLNIGTGVTNLPSTSVLNFQAQNILDNVAGDGIPDIMVSQVADPSTASFSVYCFTDANGNIVGNPMQIALNSVNALGNYKTDFFTLPSGTSLNTATVNGSTTIGTNTRPIRMVGYKLSDFGITETNKAQVTQFKVMPSGTSDPAFMAYNRNSFAIPAPEIVGHPQSVALCPGGTANFSVTLTASGTETAYQWEKNGIAISNGTTAGGSVISGATGPTLTITGVVNSDNGIYRCVVTNPAGAALSNPAYLNTVVLSASPASGTCINTPATIFVSAAGNTPLYQWYRSTTNSNTSGTPIDGATASTYSPPVDTAGTLYYYTESYPSGYSCARTVSSTIPFTVYGSSVAGNVSDNQTVCPNTPATISITGANGAIQWQSTQVANGASGWADIAGANAATYTIASVTGITYYRAIVTNGTCGSATSALTSVTANTTYIWTGNDSTNWNTATNWSCNLVPTAQVDVTIPAAPFYQPTVNNDGLAHAKSLIVNAGAHLTIATGGSLQVVNAIQVGETGTFVVENNGALIQDNETNNSGIVTVKRNSNPLYRLDYTLWSSPVSNQLLKDFSTSTAANRYYEYKYDTANGSTYSEGYWPVNPLSTYFTAGKAFLIRMPNANGNVPGYTEGTATTIFNGNFTGTPYNGTVQIPLSVQGNRYTAVGNPYASPISITNFFDQNQGVLRAGSPIYIWRKKNNSLVSSYATITKSAFVANTAIWETTGEPTPEYTSGGQTQAGYFTGGSENWTLSQGQGFLVQTVAEATTSPLLTFTNAMRKPVPATGGQSFFKQTAAQQSRLWLNLADTNNSFSQLAVAYSAGQTLGLDYGYDGLSLSQDNITIYTLADENALTIQSRPAFDATDVVPVGYIANAAGTYTISLDHVDGVFATGQKIYLRDNTEGVVRDLALGNYTFTTTAGTINDRFDIIYTNTTDSELGIDTPVLDPNTVIVYKQNSTINITSGNALMSSVTVYDIRGRVLYSQDKINATETAINNLSVQQEVIIVEVATDKGTVSKKVIF